MGHWRDGHTTPTPSLLLTASHAHFSCIFQIDCELDLSWKRGVSWPFKYIIVFPMLFVRSCYSCCVGVLSSVFLYVCIVVSHVMKQSQRKRRDGSHCRGFNRVISKHKLFVNPLHLDLSIHHLTSPHDIVFHAVNQTICITTAMLKQILSLPHWKSQRYGADYVVQMSKCISIKITSNAKTF